MESTVDGVPTIIMGDMNTVLPYSPKLSNNWYRLRPFSVQSRILYDFICDQELCVANFLQEQNLNYTYYKAGTTSYIDHILVPLHAENVRKCSILDDLSDNTSDHLALSLAICVPSCVETNCVAASTDEYVPITRPDWNNPKYIQSYKQQVKADIGRIPVIEPDKVKPGDAQDVINNLSSTVCAILLQTSTECMEPFNKKLSKYVKNSWWNKSCYLAKNVIDFTFFCGKVVGNQRLVRFITAIKKQGMHTVELVVMPLEQKNK